MNHDSYSRKNNNKKLKKRGILLSLATAFGIVGEHQINESTQYRHSATEYIQNLSDIKYLNDQQEVFYNWDVVKNNPNTLKDLLDEIFATDYEKVDKNNIKQFVQIRKQLLRNLVSILRSQYNKGSPEYNEMLNKVIPSIVDYLKVETNMLPNSAKETIEFTEYRKELLDSK